MKIIKVADVCSVVDITAKIAAKYARNGGRNCIIFSEDKITLQIELEVAAKSGGGFFGVDVTTFRRYTSQFSRGVSVLSKESAVMLVRRIISENEENLGCFSASARKPNFALTVYELISQLKSAKVTPEDLEKLDGSEISGALADKIKNIAFVFKKYDELLKEKELTDSNDYLSLTPKIIESDESLKNAVVILSGFSSLTRQRADVFSALEKSAKEVYAVVLGVDGSEVYTGETLEKLCKITTNTEVFSKCGQSAECRAISRYLYSPSVFRRDFVPLKTDKVKIYEYSAPDSEVKSVAKEIINLTRNKKVRFNEIAVAAGDINVYAPIIKRVFKKCRIPFFADIQPTLSEHPVYRFINSYFKFARRGYSVNDFLDFTSGGLFCADKELTDKLSDYVLTYAFSRSLIKKEFTKENENLEEFERLRALAFKTGGYVKPKDTASGYVAAVKRALDETGCFENMKILGESLVNYGEYDVADFNEKAEEKLISVLDEINSVLGNVVMSAKDFAAIFSSGAEAAKIGSIPLFSDAVYVGEMKDVKIRNAKRLFAIGLSGDVPFTKSDVSLLSDGDLGKLDGFKIIVEPKIKAVNEREKENVGVALMSFTDGLYASFSDTTASGGEGLRSEIINYLVKIFGISPIKESEVLIDTSLDYSSYECALEKVASLKNSYEKGDISSREEIASFYGALKEFSLSGDKAADYIKEAADELLSPEKKAERIYGEQMLKNGGYVSATTLEKYFSCPYSNFAFNALKLKEDKTGEFRVTDTGTLLHALLEKYAEKLDEITGKEESDKIVEDVMNELLSGEEYSAYATSPQFAYVFKNLIKEGKRVCYAVYRSIKESGFSPKLFEASFGDGEKFAAIPLKTKSGEYKVRGKVDRIDGYKNRIRVIDYKTGAIKPQDEYFYTGNKLQLYLYMNAFVKNGVAPAGAYYFPVHDGFVKEGEKDYVMRGKTSKNAEILNATDPKIATDSGAEFISARLKKDGEPYAYSEVLSDEDIKKYLDYAVKISEKGAEEIASGFIAPTPYENACKYCKYSGMCKQGEENAAERKVKGVTSETITRAVSGATDDKNGGGDL